MRWNGPHDCPGGAPKQRADSQRGLDDVYVLGHAGGVTLALRRLTGKHRPEASLTVPTRVDPTKRNYLRGVR